MFKLIFSIIRLFDSGQRNYDQPTEAVTPYKNQAQSADELKGRIRDLPKARVVWVIDGDTAIVLQGRRKFPVRLDSIDCPEDGQEWGDIAKYGLIKLIGRQQVYLEEHGVDVHGRTLATLYIWNADKFDWLNINERMVTLGHAWVMRKFYDHLPQDRQDKLNNLERWARSKKIGLWRAENPTPPWEWRSGHS